MPVVVFAGVVFFAVFAVFEAGTAAFLILGPFVTGDFGVETGKAFFVPIGVRAVVFETLSVVVLDAVTGAFLAGVTEGVVDVVFAGVDDAVELSLTGAFFTGAGVVVPVVPDDEVRLSFTGAFLTGDVAEVVVFAVATGAVFLTGVDARCVAAGVVFVAVDEAFFAVCEVP